MTVVTCRLHYAEYFYKKLIIMFGHLGEDAIEIILRRQLIGHIGCHANDTTYVVPISYAYEDNCVYAHTHEGMKLNMMRQNPKVCFEVYAMENMANWQSVVAWGDFEEVTDKSTREKNYIPQTTVNGFTYIAPDNLYLNSHCKLVYSETY